MRKIVARGWGRCGGDTERGKALNPWHKGGKSLLKLSPIF